VISENKVKEVDKLSHRRHLSDARIHQSKTQSDRDEAPEKQSGSAIDQDEREYALLVCQTDF
jgi:hypothetical protein